MKAELIPTISYGDGRPWDVGTDRALANTINKYIDYKSAHQNPVLFNEIAVSSDSLFYYPIYAGVIFAGMDYVDANINRYLTAAPFFRSTDGTTATVRMRITRSRPTMGPSVLETTQYLNAQCHDAFAMATWTSTSTTWAVGADATLDLTPKNPEWGTLWLIVDITGHCEARNLSKCVESARRVL